jgi:radical SAM superfamily enzyme YgiQ (UPF0313 family)
MQILTVDRPRARVGCFVPRWTEFEPGRDPQGAPYRAFPVVGALVRAGFEVIWFDQEVDWDRADRTAELRAALAGVDVMLLYTAELWPATQLENLRRFAALVRSWYPAMKLVVGGVFISICTPQILDVAGPWTCFLRGFGEDHAPELVDRLLRGLPPDVPGAVWREDGVLHHRDVKSRPRYPSDDNLEAWRLIDPAPYVQPRGGIFGNGEPTIVIGTGRGCAKGCDFCYWRAEAPAIASAPAIVELVESIRARVGVRQFHFAELDFFTNKSRPLALARLWRERLPDCIWFALCSPIDGIRFDDADWELLASGGCRKIELGTETGSPRLLEVIGKRHTPAQVEQLNSTLVRHGLHVLHNFIFAIPDEVADDRRRSVELMERLFRRDPTAVTFAVRLYQASLLTPLGERALRGTGAFPRTLDEFDGYRSTYAGVHARAMPWVAQRDERAAKRLTHHVLPLATSRLPVGPGWRRSIYHGLRRLAWWRARSQMLALPVDEWVYHRLFTDRLTRTYRP